MVSRRVASNRARRREPAADRMSRPRTVSVNPVCTTVNLACLARSTQSPCCCR